MIQLSRRNSFYALVLHVCLDHKSILCLFRLTGWFSYVRDVHQNVVFHIFIGVLDSNSLLASLAIFTNIQVTYSGDVIVLFSIHFFLNFFTSFLLFYSSPPSWSRLIACSVFTSNLSIGLPTSLVPNLRCNIEKLLYMSTVVVQIR